jgi:membrane complex biogenesis BtpA family protein
MADIDTLLRAGNALIGMVHVQALPSAPFHRHSIDQIVDRAEEEAAALASAGFDGLIIENMHDRPYVHGSIGPETVACMTRVGLAVRAAARSAGEDLPVGVQVLSGGNREALAIAQAIGGQFIRCENFVFAHVADEGLLATAEAGSLLRYRRQIGAERIRVFADLKKKHASHSITADVTLADAARAARFFGADGVIVTGAATGEPTRIEDVAVASDAVDLPVLVGSGVTPESVGPLLEHADGLIVGSYLKQFGFWENALDPDRCREIVASRDRARRASHAAQKSATPGRAKTQGSRSRNAR